MRTDFRQILTVLADHHVDFILVGAMSAVLQGAPVMTLGIDIVHECSDENVARLQTALETLNARYRDRPGAPVCPAESHLKSPGHQLRITELGPLDVLGSIEDGLDFQALLPKSTELKLSWGTVRVLSLAAYVATRRLQRDRRTKRLPVLRETLKTLKAEEE